MHRSTFEDKQYFVQYKTKQQAFETSEIIKAESLLKHNNVIHKKKKWH